MVIIKPYHKKWTTYELGRKLISEDIERIISEAKDESQVIIDTNILVFPR